MGLSCYDIKKILNPKFNNYPSDDFRIIDSWTLYHENPGVKINDRKLNYLCYELESIDPETGEKTHYYKAIKLARVDRIPKSAKQSTALMDMQAQVLSSAWQQGFNLITIIANIIKPAVGLLYLYGVQGVSTSLEDAKKEADRAYTGFMYSMQATYKVLELRCICAEEAEWLREKMYSMEYMTVVRGIPKAQEGGVDAGDKGIGGKNLNPQSQGTLEEMIIGMADYEYVLEVISTPVYRNTLEEWSLRTQRDMTDWYGQLQGNKSFSMGISLPMMFAANQSSSQGWNKAYTDAESVSHSQGESFSTSYGENVGQALSQSYGQSIGQSRGMSVTDSASQSHSISQGQSFGQNWGSSFGQSIGSSFNQSVGQGQSISHNEGTSTGESFGTSQGQSYGFSQGQNVSKSHNVGTNQSFGQTLTETVGRTNSSTIGQTATQSTGQSFNNSYSSGTSQSVSSSGSHGTNSSTSYNSSQTTGSSHTSGSSDTAGGSVGAFGLGANYSHGWNRSDSTSQSSSTGMGSSYGTSDTIGWGTSTGTSNSVSSGSSVSNSSSLANSSSLSESLSHSQGVSNSQTFGTSESYGTSYGQSMSENWGVNQSTSHSQNISQNVSNGWGQNISMSTGIGQNVGQSSSQNEGMSASLSNSESYGVSQGRSVGTSYSESVTQSISQGTTQSYGKSQSIGQGQSYTDGTSSSTSQSTGSSGAYVQGASSSMGMGPSIGYNKSYIWMDQEVKDILELLEFQNERLKLALRDGGAFYTYVYIACSSQDALSAAMTIAKSTWRNEYALTAPLQVLNLTDEEQKHLLYHFSAFSSDVTKEDISGLRDYKYATVLLPGEYVAYTHLPRISEGGIFAEANDIPKFSVPGQLKGEVYMGTILSAERYTMLNGYRTPHDYRIDEAQMMHGFFTGASRSGKTVAAMRFIAELAQVKRKSTGKRFRIVCMDPKQDWRTLARFVEPERFRFFSLGNTRFRPVKINPLKIPHGVVPQVWIDGVIDIYCRAYGLLERGKQMLGETIYSLYEEAGVFEACNYPGWEDKVSELSREVTFTRVYQKMSEIKAGYEDPTNPRGRIGNDTRDAYARLLDRLQAFNREFSIEYKLFGTSEGISIDELIGNDDVTVLESKGLENTFRNFIFGVITSGFYKYALAHEKGYLADDQYETVLVIEEANEVLIGNDAAGSAASGRGSSGASLSGQSEFEQILDQSAGYGLFIIAITQKVADMPKSIISNSGLIFAGRLVSTDDITVVTRCIGREERYEDRDIVKWFPRSPTGWFVCKSGRTYSFKDAEPVLVQISRLNIAPPSNAEIDEILLKKEASEKLNTVIV